MASEFSDHVDKFIQSLNNNLPNIFYQAFDFSKVQDSRTKLLNLNYDKNKVSFVNLEMIIDLFQLLSAVHNAIDKTSSKDFSVAVPLQLCKSRAVGDALKLFGGFGKPFIVVVSILDQTESEELFEKISKIENVTKMTREQMEDCMKKNIENIRQYYFELSNNETSIYDRNLVGEIVSRMILSKNV